MKNSIAVLVTHDYYPDRIDRAEPDYAGVQLRALQEALGAFDLGVTPVFWQDDGTDWASFKAVLPLMAWNYPRQTELFLTRLNEIAAAGTKMLNHHELVRANMDKNYLIALAAAGAPVPATISVPFCTPQSVEAAFKQFGCDEIIIKPRVGAGAWRQVRLKQGATLPAAELLPPDGALIQPFLASVTSQGEMSLLYFGGVFSHALIKTPKVGDYRTQGQYGAHETAISPPDSATDAAKAVLANLDGPPPLYARVDLVQGKDGQWLLMELELIEPWLYLSHDGAGGRKAANMLAQALVDQMSAHAIKLG